MTVAELEQIKLHQEIVQNMYFSFYWKLHIDVFIGGKLARQLLRLDPENHIVVHFYNFINELMHNRSIKNGVFTHRTIMIAFNLIFAAIVLLISTIGFVEITTVANITVTADITRKPLFV